MEQFISRNTVDDLIRQVIELLLSFGQKIETTKKSSIEINGILLELSNPLARLSRTETRGKLFSPLGELCWYLAGTKKLDFIQYYLSRYSESAEDDEIPGAYGPRLFNWDGINQIANVTSRLKQKPTTRRAAVQLFSAADLVHKEVPCTCTFQFLLRDQKQELIARELSVELGTYKHFVGSLHLYDDKQEEAKQFLDEGLQPTNMYMPAMPEGNPWPAITSLLEAEQQIRTGQEFDEKQLTPSDSYWADLTRLLLIFRADRDKKMERIRELRREMASNYFHTFIDMRIESLISSHSEKA
jgi:thymidylate synthase